MEVGVYDWCPSCGGIGTKMICGVVWRCPSCSGSGKNQQKTIYTINDIGVE